MIFLLLLLFSFVFRKTDHLPCLISFLGKLFVGGGFDGSHAISCVEMYDPNRNEWKMMGNMTSPRSNAGIATVGNTIYAVGGFDGNEFLNTVEVYNLESNEWSPYTKIFQF